jgi:hypothetical protein
MIHYNDQSYMKPLEKTSVPERPLRSSITFSMMRSRKDKWFSNICPQIRRYFGKAYVQDERVCILKKQAGARGDNFFIEKGRDDSQIGREH